MPFSNTIETYYDQIIANIDQLNLAAGKGEVHVQHNERGNGASFKVNFPSYFRFFFPLSPLSFSLSVTFFENMQFIVIYDMKK